MSAGFQPRWLRLSEALDFLKNRGLTLDDAKEALRRAIQDRLDPRSVRRMFRLPEWRYSSRFPGRSWVTTPIINWDNSTIVAPHAMGMRRVSADYPTLIEVAAEVLDREFPHPRSSRDASSRDDPAATPAPSSMQTRRRTRPTVATYAEHWKQFETRDGKHPSREDDMSWAKANGHSVKHVLDILRKEYVAALPDDKKPSNGPRKSRAQTPGDSPRRGRT
jgi:hypothetical protein